MKDLRQLFGTDGIRGVANVDLTPEFVLKVGKAGAKYLSSDDMAVKKILIGRDTRPSGEFISGALVSAILASGISVLDAGIITTPAVALIIKILELDGGIVISASHNPVEDNSIKFFARAGQKLTDYQEKSIEDYILAEDFKENNAPKGADVGRYNILDNAYDLYMGYLKNIFNLNLAGIKVALDCANGAASILGPLVFRQFGADVIPFNCDTTGILINKGCGATHPEFISRSTVESGADIGFHLTEMQTG